jgi:hypothetical protein
VIDNAEMVMDAAGFWAQLNYQLIHLLDFLPAASWALHTGDNFLDNFSSIYGLLQKVRAASGPAYGPAFGASFRWRLCECLCSLTSA